MRPRTLRRRGQFYHRKRSHWRLNLALALIGVALVGFVVVDMRAGSPPPAPAEDTAKQIAALTTHAPAQTAPAELGSAALAATASAPVSAPPRRPGRPSALVAGSAHDANRRGVDAAGAGLGGPTVRDVDVTERAPVARPLPPGSPKPPEGCKTCGDDVPF
jgi:hypothetical protein